MSVLVNYKNKNQEPGTKNQDFNCQKASFIRLFLYLFIRLFKIL